LSGGTPPNLAPIAHIVFGNPFQRHFGACQADIYGAFYGKNILTAAFVGQPEYRLLAMAMNVRHPLWLPAAPAPGMGVFSLLFMIESIARASLETVVPLKAYAIQKEEPRVSFL
jgi:hypothetical protein